MTWRYAIGSLGTGGFATLPGLVLLYFLTDALGVPAWLGGLVVALAKLWDVLVDPMIGAISDRSAARTGSRRGLMLVGALSLPVFFIATFAVPQGTDPVWAAIWVLVAFIATSTAFSCFQVPYMVLPAEIASTYNARAKLLGWRVVVLSVAILLFGAGGPELRSIGGPATGYLIMAVVAGLVIAAGMLVAVTVAPRRQPTPVTGSLATAAAAGYRDGLRVLRQSRPLRILILAFLLQALATGIMLAAANYVATWVMGDEKALTPLFLALIAPAIALSPAWAALATRVGKRSTFVISTLMFTAAAASLVIAVWAPGPWIYGSVALAGAAYSGMQVLPMSMLPDVIVHDQAVSRRDRAGVISGVWTAGETTGMAIGAALFSVALVVGGYQESVAGQSVEQPASAVAAIALAFSALPAALAALSLIPLARYPLTRADVDALGTLDAGAETDLDDHGVTDPATSPAPSSPRQDTP